MHNKIFIKVFIKKIIEKNGKQVVVRADYRFYLARKDLRVESQTLISRVEQKIPSYDFTKWSHEDCRLVPQFPGRRLFVRHGLIRLDYANPR